MKPFSAPVNFSNAAYFYLDNSGQIGTFSKSPIAQTLITLDYSQSITSNATISKAAYILDVQSTPMLVISNSVGTAQQLTFILSGGWAGLTYNLTVQAHLSDGSTRTDDLTIEILGDDCMRYDPCCPPMGRPLSVPSRIPKAFQQAAMSTNCSVYKSACISYYICDTAPVNPNVMDQWYNTINHGIYEYLTDGVNFWWQPFFVNVKYAVASLYYQATAGQTVFNTMTPDLLGNSGVINPTDFVQAYVNGVRLVPTTDFTFVSPSTVTLLRPIPSTDVVMIDILAPTVITPPSGGGGGGNTSVVISDSAPANPVNGDLWFDSVGGQLYIWYSDPNGAQWVVVVNAGSGGGTGGGGTASAGITISDTAPTNPTIGALWYASTICQLFVWYNDGNSSQWVVAVNE
jgi:hypothetical protein